VSSKNAGVENAAPDCRGGKCGTRLQGWKTREWKTQESEKYEQTRTLLLHKGGLSRDDFLGENSAQETFITIDIHPSINCIS